MDALQGKVAIFTGASRGIGSAIAALFAREGARVVCAARTVHEGEHLWSAKIYGIQAARSKRVYSW
jgi:NAD(P)-dependent dehydrogenase (short-subunit alcohol dehydrogenase family)